MALRWFSWVRAGVGLTSVLLLGCFSDVNSSTGGTSGESTGSATGDCVAGARGCPCYGNQTCDEGLECLEGIACFPPGCIPGTQACPCLSGGGCDVGLVCEGAQCLPGGASGGSDSTTASTMSTTADTTDSGPATTDPTDPSDSASSTTGIGICDLVDVEPACDACAKTHCCDELTACLAEPNCMGMLECAEPGMPFEPCASTHAAGGVEFEVLTACIADVPLNLGCGACLPPTLVCAEMFLESPVYWACTECAALNCCDELRECLGDPHCACMEACLANPTTDNDYDTCLTGLCSGFSPNDLAYGSLADCTGENGCTNEAADVCYPLAVFNPG